jgi:hypothetical protein
MIPEKSEGEVDILWDLRKLTRYLGTRVKRRQKYHEWVVVLKKGGLAATLVKGACTLR